MQRTERMTVAHHRSDFIYHVSRADWQEEWGERQDDDRRVSKPNVKAPVLKIFLILKSLLTCHLSKVILEVFLTFVSHLFGSTVFADFYFI